MLQDRAGVQSANLLEDRIRSMRDGQIFDVITHGFGLMSSYAYQLQPQDRWAVVAYVRQLQQQANSAAAAQLEPVPTPEGQQTEPEAAPENEENE